MLIDTDVAALVRFLLVSQVGLVLGQREDLVTVLLPEARLQFVEVAVDTLKLSCLLPRNLVAGNLRLIATLAELNLFFWVDRGLLVRHRIAVWLLHVLLKGGLGGWLLRRNAWRVRWVRVHLAVRNRSAVH